MRVFYPRFSQQQLIEHLRSRMGDLSVASDVDLLVICEGEPGKDAYALVKRVLGIPGLEPHIYSSEEYEQLKGMILRMASGGVILFPEHKPADPMAALSENDICL